MSPAPTLQQKLEQARFRPAGFDYLRILLACAVMLSHTLRIDYGQSAESWFWTGPLRPLIYAVVPAFFALSGFLVASSLTRNSLPTFALLRALRIFPALLVEITFSALLIGPLVTSLPLAAYFTHPRFFHYFENGVGYIHYRLPGVFAGLPGGDLVNLQLWTVPYELRCYLALGGLALLGLTRRPWLFVVAVLLWVGGDIAQDALTHQIPLLDSRMPGAVLVSSFLAGVALYLWRDRVPSHSLLWALALASYALTVRSPLLGDLAALPLAYLTIAVGVSDPRRIGLVKGADYSYGLYIYGYPAQQLVCLALPHWRFWWVNFAGGLLLAGLGAMLSWHLIEAPVLHRRERILKAISRY